MGEIRANLVQKLQFYVEPFLAYPENSSFWTKNIKMAPQAQSFTQSQKFFRL